MNPSAVPPTNTPTQPTGAAASPPRFPWAILFFVWLLVLITATMVTMILPESFSSTAKIRVERDNTDIPPFQGPSYSNSYDPYFIQTEFELIQSQEILGKVIDKLNLNEVWGAKSLGPGQVLKTQETLMMLRAKLALNTVRNTSLIEIRVFDEKPEQAALLANEIAKAYEAYRKDKRESLTKGGIKALEDRFKEQDAKVQQAQTRVENLREKLQISDSTVSADAPAARLSAETLRRIETLRVESAAELARQQTMLDKLMSLNKAQQIQVIPSVAGDALLSSLLEQLAQVEQKLVSAEQDPGAEKVELKKLKAAREHLNAITEARVASVLLVLDTRVAALRTNLATLEREVELATSNDIAKASQSQPYFEAKHRLEELQRFSQMLTYKIASENTDLALPKSTMVEILERAVPGLKPVRPNKPLNIALGIVIGGVAGVFLATGVFVVQLRAYRRLTAVARTQFSPRFRAVMHILIALAAGIVLGYTIALPLSWGSLIGMPLVLLLCAGASAYIELARPYSEPAPAAAPGQTKPGSTAG